MDFDVASGNKALHQQVTSPLRHAEKLAENEACPLKVRTNLNIFYFFINIG